MSSSDYSDAVSIPKPKKRLLEQLFDRQKAEKELAEKKQAKRARKQQEAEHKAGFDALTQEEQIAQLLAKRPPAPPARTNSQAKYPRDTKLSDLPSNDPWVRNARLILPDNLGGNLEYWNDQTLDFIVAQLDQSDDVFLVGLKNKIQDHIKSDAFNIKQVDELFCYGNSGDGEGSALHQPFINDLSKSTDIEDTRMSRGSVVDNEKDDGGIKPLVVVGESGSGKTCYAARMRRLEILDLYGDNEKPVVHATTFYAKINTDPLESDTKYKNASTVKKKKNRRNKLARNCLKTIFKDCCDQLFKKHNPLSDGTPASKSYRKELAILVCIDELGSHGELLRGFINQSALFQKDMLTMYEFGGVSLVFAGTGLDIAVSEGEEWSDLASDPGLYRLVTLQRWKAEDALKFAAKFPPKWFTADQMVIAFRTALQYPLLQALCGNARAVSFMYETIRDLLRGFKHPKNRENDKAWPEEAVKLSLSFIFQLVVKKYLYANGVSKLTSTNMSVSFVEHISTALSSGMSGSIPTDKHKKDVCRRCLIYGLLSYNPYSDVVMMSPALLVMCLSQFGGISDLSVSDGASFESLVMMREVAKILANDSEANIILRRLSAPIPNTGANTHCAKQSGNKFTMKWDPDTFKVKDGKLVPIIENTGKNYLIVLNGPRAAFAGIFVFHPNNEDSVWRLHLIQVKLSKDGYKPNINDVKEENSKMGVGDDQYKWSNHPASQVVCNLLGDSNYRSATFVVSKGSLDDLDVNVRELLFKQKVNWEVIEDVFKPFILSDDQTRPIPSNSLKLEVKCDQRQYSIVSVGL